jgi:hypothetical protein
MFLKLKLFREHYGNVLHLWCRLLDLGLSEARAKALAILLTKKIR